ncbi:MAG: hypothetical protein AAGA64_07100 [Bacteroidota bacterium]
MGKIYSDLNENLYSGQVHYEKYHWLKKYFIDVLRDFKGKPEIDSVLSMIYAL